jgi:hypothetical protein
MAGGLAKWRITIVEHRSNQAPEGDPWDEFERYLTSILRLSWWKRYWKPLTALGLGRFVVPRVASIIADLIATAFLATDTWLRSIACISC